MTRGGSEAAWEPVPMAVGLAGIENRGGGAAARCGGRERRQQGGGWDQEKPERLGGTSIGSGGGRWAGKTSGGGAAEAPVMLEVGDELKDWSAICEKSRGLSVK